MEPLPRKSHGDGGKSESPSNINRTLIVCSFYINLPIGAVSAAIIMFFFQTPKNAKPIKATKMEKLLQMDFPGTFILMAALVCLILALQWGGTTKSWNSGDVIGTLVVFGVLMIVFVANEWYMGERALFQSRLLKQKTIIIMSLFITFIAGPFFVELYYLPLYFQSIDGVSASQSGKSSRQSSHWSGLTNL